METSIQYGSPQKSPSRNKLEYISGPVSWTGFDDGEKSYHFFGDAHQSKSGSCEDNGIICSKIKDKNPNTNCRTIDSLIEGILEYSGENKVYVDVFLESYYQSKKQNLPRKKAAEFRHRREKSDYLRDVEDFLVDFFDSYKDVKIEKYLGVHYIDIRFMVNTESNDLIIEPFMLFSKFFGDINTKINFIIKSPRLNDENKIKIIFMYQNLVKAVFQAIKIGRFDYHKNLEFDSFIETISQINDFISQNFPDFTQLILNEMQNLLDIVKNGMKFSKITEKMNIPIYSKELQSLRKRDIIINNRNVADMIEEFIDSKIKTIINTADEYLEKDFNVFIFELQKLSLSLGAVLMDGFLLCKIFKNKKNGKQIILVYTGSLHTESYVEFFQKYIGLTPIPSPIHNGSDQKDYRCLKDKNFSEIFGKWLGSSR